MSRTWYVEFWSKGALIVTVAVASADIELARRDAVEQLRGRAEAESKIEALSTAEAIVRRSFRE